MQAGTMGDDMQEWVNAYCFHLIDDHTLENPSAEDMPDRDNGNQSEKSYLAGDGEQHHALPEREVGETTLLEHLAAKAEVPQNEAARESKDLGGKR
jgi:hypothetical protein